MDGLDARTMETKCLLYSNPEDDQHIVDSLTLFQLTGKLQCKATDKSFKQVQNCLRRSDQLFT